MSDDGASTTVAPAPTSARRKSEVPLPTNWPWLFEWFRWYSGRYMAKHFHTLRVSRTGPAPDVGDRPMVVVLNHPSWWDPLTCYRLSYLFPRHAHYAPMQAAALARYGILTKVGIFGIDTGSVRGAATFLRTATAILSRPRMTLWVTAQGHFADARCRPAGLQPGVGHLASRLQEGLIVPLAVEYPFWNERTPEALVRFGPAIDLATAPADDPIGWTTRIETALLATQDALAAEAIARDPAAFTTLVRGRTGIGGVYDTWRRCTAWIGGRRFSAAHEDERGDGC
jgi:1-acyl-sn-glycerol-3-phosphate acyltransferase